MRVLHSILVTHIKGISVFSNGRLGLGPGVYSEVCNTVVGGTRGGKVIQGVFDRLCIARCYD